MIITPIMMQSIISPILQRPPMSAEAELRISQMPPRKCSRHLSISIKTAESGSAIPS